MSFDIAKSESSTPLATCMWEWCMCQIYMWLYLIARKKELSCTYSPNNSGMHSLWALINLFFPQLGWVCISEHFPWISSGFSSLRPGCSVNLFNSSYFSNCGKLAFLFIKASDCITDCPSRQEIYGKTSVTSDWGFVQLLHSLIMTLQDEGRI